MKTVRIDKGMVMPQMLIEEHISHAVFSKAESMTIDVYDSVASVAWPIQRLERWT